MNNQPKFKKGDIVLAHGCVCHYIGKGKENIAVVQMFGEKELWTYDEYEISLVDVHNQPALSDMLAIPDDHVWPVTSDNEVVIVDELFEKQKESFIKAATSMTGSATLTPEFKALGEFATKLDSVDQELEDAANQAYKRGEGMGIAVAMIAKAEFQLGANWKAEQVANDAIEFISDTMGVSKESIINLYEIWQQSKNR